MAGFCQGIAMFFSERARRGVVSIGPGGIKLGWQVLLVGLLLTSVPGEVGILRPPAKTVSGPPGCSEQEGRESAFASERGFPRSAHFFNEGRNTTSDPGEPQPPRRPIDRMWEGPLPPAEAALLADAADGHLDHHTLLRAALIAGGLFQEEQIHQYETKFNAWIAQLREQNVTAQPPLQRAEIIFQFMHERILTGGYELRASDLAATLENGRFNCVSASLLYHCLVEQFGIKAWGLEMPGHARTRLLLPEAVLDVETTCSRWFELLRNPEKSLLEREVARTGVTLAWSQTAEASTSQTLTTVQPQADRTDASPPMQKEDVALQGRSSGREVASLALVATIYYNRGVDFLAEGRYPEALSANAKALRLDPEHPSAWGNFLATMNNWSVALGRSGRYPEAAALLAHGLALAPSYKPFQTNFVHVHSQWTEQLCRQGRFAEALEVLTRSAPQAPAQYTNVFREAQLRVAKQWTKVCLSRGDTAQALSIWQELCTWLGPSQDVLEAQAAALQDGLQENPIPIPSPKPTAQDTTVSAPTPTEIP